MLRRSPLRATLLVAATALLCLLALAPAALAAPLAGSAFDTGDGNQDNAVGLDWQGAATAGRVKESPDANDDCFVGGVKELTPNQWAFNRSAGGCTPGKSNLRVAYANPESASGTTFGHFAFFRNDTTGNSFLTFELNQTAASWKNAADTTIPCRSNGDVLLSFEVGGSTLTTSLYKWNGDGSGPAACPNGANGTFTGSGAIPPTRFQGAMNAAALIQNYVNVAAYGPTFPANSFGEAAIDLPAVLQAMGHSPCFGFLQMQVHSRSSSSISSAMIDYTTPTPVYIQSCAVTGTQYQDTNGNGARDGGEPPLAGSTVYADLDNDSVRDTGEPSGVSDADGFYRLLNVPAGSVVVRQVPRAGWRCSQPSPCSYTRTLTTGGNSTGNDFGNLGPSSATGTTFDDLDADGGRDAGEPGLGGVTVYADLDDDAALDAGEPSGVADGDGDWTVSDIPAGSYRLRQVTPVGWTCSSPDPCSSLQSFSSGSAVSGIAFGSWSGATLGGRVFEDADGDGAAFEAGDTTAAGRQVYVDADGDATFDLGELQTTTDAAGLYSFTGLEPGTYTVRPVLPSASWYCTRPGTDAATCAATQTLISAQPAGGRDFALTRYATVSGTAWEDIDGVGDRDAGDAGIAGFTQYVDYDGDSTLDAGEPSAVSATGGAYTITGVRAGAWTLRALPNGAYKCTSPAATCTYALALGSGATAAARDFGHYVSRSVSGVVFNDANKSGASDAGERGLAGWTVYADEVNDNALTAGEPQAVTNSLGQYNLTGLANGSYEIRIVAQPGWTCSAPAGCINTGSIGSGQSDTGMSFGVWGPSTVAGMVFEDADADGAAQEAGEDGLSDRVVYADLNNDGDRDGGEPSSTSGVSGAWAIPGLDPGTYTLRQELPAGWTCRRPAAPCTHTVVTSSGNLTGKDFGSSTTATISGTVLEDTDADGDGDTGLGGRTVYLDTDGNGAHDGGEPSATSAASGSYSLGAVGPGTHVVRQVVPAGWTQSAPSAPYTVTVRSGGSVTGRDFASWTGGSIAGSVFEDADFDGSAREAGDNGTAGRVVYLDENGDGAKDDGEPSTTTDGTGAYGFTGLRPGAYTVRPVLPADWACAYPASCSAAVDVASGASVTGRDFGSYVGASVSGTVFEDLDADGATREAGEPGAAGRRVYLDGDGSGTRSAGEPSVLTGADGSYAFTGIVAQSWQVRLELPAAWSCDRPATPCRHDVTLTSGASVADRDFGVHTTGTISGHLFTDRDAKGDPQAFGENDQPERTVFLDADGNGALDGGERSVQTNDNGNYAFLGVAPGDYRVRQVLPAGWTCSRPSPCVYDVTVQSGAASTGNDFSSWTTASFTGVYFEDEDGDGDYPEPGDGGVAGRTVYLDVVDNDAYDAGEPTTTTAANGTFGFASLTPGAYEVRAAGQPSGWTCSYPKPCVEALTLEAAESAQDVNFGAYTDGVVSGTVSRAGTGTGLSGWTVWAESDGDGVREAGEPTATTSASGGYSLALAPGAWKVRQVVPATWTCSTPDPCAWDVTVTSQGAVTGRDFANVQDGGSVAGTVREDVDADGDGDRPLAGRTVYVDVDDDGTRDDGEPSAASAADGTYAIADLGPATHVVRIVGAAGSTCSSPVPCSRSAEVVAGETAGGNDFALWLDASITGVVSDDTDGDGTRDAGEPGLDGRTVWIDADGDGGLDDDEARTTTDGNGAFSIGTLKPAEHLVRIASGADWRCTGAAGCTTRVTVASGATGTAALSTWKVSTVSGTVFEDTDADGAAREAGEPGLGGREVWLDLDDDGDREAGDPVATTDAGGAYVFTGLAPGAHRVRVTVPAAWRCTRPDPCTASVTTTSGSTPSAPAFGLVAVTADLSVTLDRTPATLVAGRPASWTATVQNAGPFAADGATVALTLPAGLTGVTWTGATCTRSGAVLTCALGDLAPGASVDVKLDGDVAPSAAGTPLPLSAVVDSTLPDPDPSDDEATQAPVPTAIADLVAGASLPPKATVGEVVDLVVEVLNDGPSDATNLKLVATLPEGLEPVVADLPPGCTAAGRVVTCTADALPLGAALERTLKVTVGPEAGDKALVVPVAATSDADDPTPADAQTEVDFAGVPSADVQVAVSDPPKASGDTVSYGLTVHNEGPSPATDVVLVDGPFPGATVTSVTTDKGTCEVLADGSIKCTLGTLAPGEDVRLAIELAVDGDVDPASIVPGPAANGKEADPAPADNARTLTLPSRIARRPAAPAPAAAAAAPAQAAEPRLEIVEPRAAVVCASFRAFDVKVRRRSSVRLRSVRMWLAESPLRVLKRDGRFTARIDLRGKAAGTYVLKIRARTRSGKLVTGTRTYHTCERKRPKTVPKF